MSTWLDRVKGVLGARGYENCMRRSLQSIVLYEAKRCVEPQLSSLRPFQRKQVMMDQIYALVNSLDFLYPHQRNEILWRTATSKECISPEIAWKRQQLICKELKRLSEQIQDFLTRERTHDEAVDMLEQSLFEKAGDNQGKSNHGKSVPVNWSHAHNHCLLTFRLYYKGAELDPTFPKPVIAENLVGAASVHHQQAPPPYIPGASAVENAAALAAANQVAAATNAAIQNKAGLPAYSPHVHSGAFPGAAAPPAGGGKKSQLVMAELNVGGNNNAASADPIDSRRKLLSEVREHLDLLKEFEGIISEEDLAERKRQLFMALPPAPPPAANKRARHDNV